MSTNGSKVKNIIRVFGTENGTKISKLLEKQTIVQVRNEIKKNGSWEGLAVGNNVAQSHFISGWHLAVPVLFKTETELTDYNNHALAYLNRELGNRIAFYKEVKNAQ